MKKRLILTAFMLLPLVFYTCSKEKFERPAEARKNLRVYTGKPAKHPKHAAAPERFEGVENRLKVRLTRGRRGGSIVRADIEGFDTLNIVTTRSRGAYEVLGLVFESLLSINPFNGEIQGGIAQSWDVTNDGFSLVFKLNKNVKFSDGTPCTADDVLFTFEEIYKNPEVDSRKTDILKIRDKLVEIKKLDEYTVQFDLPVPYRPFLQTLTQLQILPKHILEPVLEKNKIEYFNREWGSLDRGTSGSTFRSTERGAEELTGTGPYMIADFKKGSYLKLRRNPHYGRRDGRLHLEGMPYLDEIVELIDLEGEQKLLKFRIGELDFYDVKDADIENGNFESLLKNRREGKYRIYSAGQTLRSNHFLVFNQNSDSVDGEKLVVFRNTNFRQAVSLIIDRKELIDAVYDGYAYEEASPERSVSPYHKKLPSAAFDPARAKSLFGKVPLKDLDDDGFLDLPSGKPFQITLNTNEDNPLRVKMGEMIAAQLKKSGINAALVPMHYDLLVSKLIETFEWDGIIIGTEGSIEPNEASWIWQSDGYLHLWAPYGEEPNTEWEKRIDELFHLGRTVWSTAQARALYHEYQEIVARELPLINIMVPAELYAIRNGYQNLFPVSVSYNAIQLMPYIYARKHLRNKQM